MYFLTKWIHFEPDNLYAAQNSDNESLWISNDDGGSWQILVDQSIIANLGIASVIRYEDVVLDTSGAIYVAFTTNFLTKNMIKSTDGGATWVDITPTFFSSIAGEYNLLPASNGDIFIIDQRKIYSLQNNGLISIPWNPNNVDILGLFQILDENGNLYVNVRGSVFCTECGVYKLNNSAWSYYDAPQILGGYTPTTGIELIGDTIPVVKTIYNFTEGPLSSMGYYYYSHTPLPIGTLPIGIDEINNEINLRVYPNPSSDYFVVESQEEIEGLKMYDSGGRIVLSKKVNTGERIDIPDNLSGFYIIQVSFSKGKVNQKLLIR